VAKTSLLQFGNNYVLKRFIVKTPLVSKKFFIKTAGKNWRASIILWY